MTVQLSNMALHVYMRLRDCKFMGESVVKLGGFPLIVKSLWWLQTMHAWIVNVCAGL